MALVQRKTRYRSIQQRILEAHRDCNYHQTPSHLKTFTSYKRSSYESWRSCVLSPLYGGCGIARNWIVQRHDLRAASRDEPSIIGRWLSAILANAAFHKRAFLVRRSRSFRCLPQNELETNALSDKIYVCATFINDLYWKTVTNCIISNTCKHKSMFFDKQLRNYVGIFS